MKTRPNTLSIALATVFLGSACNGAVELGRNDGPVLGDDSGSGGSVDEGTGGTASSGGASGEGAGGIVSSGGASDGAGGTPPGGGGVGGAGGLFGGPVDGGACESEPEAWGTLLHHEWSLEPGEEAIYCVRKTLTEAVDYRALGSINPSGTHHVALSYGPPSGPDGTELCDATTSQAWPLYEVGGPGTLQVLPPDSMSSTIAAGEQILLRLHVFNITNNVLAGTSVNDVIVDEPGPFCLPDSPGGFSIGSEEVLAPGEESEFCLRYTVPMDFDYRLVQVDNPLGVLESVLSVGAPTGPDGPGLCPSVPAPGPVLAVAGAGAWNYLLPAGTSGHIEARQQLLFRVHAVNVNDRILNADSAFSFVF